MGRVMLQAAPLEVLNEMSISFRYVRLREALVCEP
jgi:hypothetical protein